MHQNHERTPAFKTPAFKTPAFKTPAFKTPAFRTGAFNITGDMHAEVDAGATDCAAHAELARGIGC